MSKEQSKQLAEAILKNELAQAKEMFKTQMTSAVASKLGDVRQDVIKKMFAK